MTDAVTHLVVDEHLAVGVHRAFPMRHSVFPTVDVDHNEAPIAARHLSLSGQRCTQLVSRPGIGNEDEGAPTFLNTLEAVTPTDPPTLVCQSSVNAACDIRTDETKATLDKDRVGVQRPGGTHNLGTSEDYVEVLTSEFFDDDIHVVLLKTEDVPQRLEGDGLAVCPRGRPPASITPLGQGGKEANLVPVSHVLRYSTLPVAMLRSTHGVELTPLPSRLDGHLVGEFHE
jgi:hypothetical protein